MAKRAAAKKPPKTDVLKDLPAFSLFRQVERMEHVNSILREHDLGIFSRSANFVDELLTDPRIAGVVEQRVAGLMSAPLVFEPADKRKKATRIAKVLGGPDKESGKWREILPQETLAQLMTWGLFLGVAVAQIIWRRFARQYTPWLYVWHPHAMYWDRQLRRFVLHTENAGRIVLPRPDEQPNGDGQWFVWCPFGVQGWTRGLIRSLAEIYVSRSWNNRDWDRHNERQGMAILKAMVPGKPPADAAGVDSLKKFWEQLARIGSEASVLCPQGVDGEPGYDVDKVEFEAQTWQAMKERKAVHDVDIAVRVLGQNLTTEVSENGSRAASQTHELVRLDKALFDSEIGPALRSQVLTHWAAWNYGDPELAPWPTYKVAPPEDKQGQAQAMKTLGEGIKALKEAEPRLNATAIVEAENYPLLTDEEVAAEEEAAAEDEPEPEEGAQDGEDGAPGADEDAEAGGEDEAGEGA